ncbi:ATP-dependent DNA helicase [Fibrobacteria bacterium R8-3-H12]
MQANNFIYFRIDEGNLFSIFPLMQLSELETIIKSGEDSGHQFKENFTNANKLAAEIVAFSNGNGGQILIGVKDNGEIGGLNLNDISRLNQLISNVCSQNVRPAINPTTENIATPSGLVLVVTVPQGISKPYSDQSGIFWTKTGADKRPASSREEILRLLAQGSAAIHADETLIPNTSEKNIDVLYFSHFFTEQYGNTPGDLNIPFKKLLENIYLLKGENLNLAGVLLFAVQPQFILPSFMIKAVAFNGIDVAETSYLDSRDIFGKLEEQFKGAISFLINNTKTSQGEQSVNSIGIPEIPKIVFEELVANAIIHRDYFTNAPIRILIFNNRIEIISPGHLPNNLTVENILFGNSNIRNPVIASFAAKILPYRGLGSGILRARKAYPKIEFKDDRDGNLFVAKVWR